MVNIGEKLFNVTFKNQAGSGVIFAHDTTEFMEAVYGLMRTLTLTTRIRVGDKRFIKERIQDAVYGMVQQPVLDRGFVDTSWLGVMNGKCLICAVLVGKITEVAMKLKNIVHEIKREPLDISFVPFAADKFFPCFQQVINTNYTFKCMGQLNFHNNDNSPIKSSTHTHTQVLPITQKFVAVYKVWDELRNNFPKKSRYTLGTKIDDLLLGTIELLFIAGTLARTQKLPVLQRASGKLDLLKFFLQLSWELKVLDNKKYAALSGPLNDIGKMLGGWMRQFIKETPDNTGEQRELRTPAKR